MKSTKRYFNLVWGVLGIGLFPLGAHAGQTTRVSVDSSGAQANGGSDRAALSANGRYVAFVSDSTNLVPGDTNLYQDVFVHDRQTGVTTRESVASNGTQANGNTGNSSLSLSADGRYVAFDSLASNLVANDTNDNYDIFVRDRQTGTTTRVSVAIGGAQANDNSFGPTLSANGRYVAFYSAASNLVANDTNEAGDVFVHDRQTGTTARVSISSNGGQGDFSSSGSSISADGRYIAFDSQSTNLVPNDTNNVDNANLNSDVFIHDRQTGITTRVNIASNGAQANDTSSGSSLSADGRYVAFTSSATNLVVGDTNQAGDVFVHDRQTGTTTRESLASNGTQANGVSYEPSLSADGRYVAFTSTATSLLEGPPSSYIFPYVFVRDRQTRTIKLASVTNDNTQSNNQSYGNRSSLSADGRYIAFNSSALNLVSGDTNQAGDVFVRDRNGDYYPSLTVSNARTFAEGNAGSAGFTTFIVKLLAPASQNVTVNYQTTNGTATAGSDYVAKSGQLTFAPGETTKSVRVDFIGDSLAELNETFFLDLRTPVGAPIARNRGSCYIRNDDGPNITIDNAVTVNEGNSGTTAQTFNVRLSAASTDTITVDWATLNGTAGPADYVVANGRLTFAPGETQKTITVQVKGDTIVEPNETYRVRLTRPIYATIADSIGIAYIRNDDSAPGVLGDAPSQ
jgi:Tol biopolymer transport system component